MAIPEGDEGRKFDSFYAELPPERYVLAGAAIPGRWGGWGRGERGEGEGGERGRGRRGKGSKLYLTIHRHHQNDFCIEMGSDERHFYAL